MKPRNKSKLSETKLGKGMDILSGIGNIATSLLNNFTDDSSIENTKDSNLSSINTLSSKSGLSSWVSDWVPQSTESMGLAGLSGAVSGAAAGATAGPWGALVGGVAGLAGGLLGAQNRNAQIEDANLQLANALRAQNNYLSEMQAKDALGNISAFGGWVGTHGGDYPTGFNSFKSGGSHEENLYGGVPQGVDQNGIPNLVEEGETKWEDYIFSNRLKVPKGFSKEYNLKNVDNTTYAKASKRISKESEERPFDKISKRGRDEMLSRLQQAQEDQKYIDSIDSQLNNLLILNGLDDTILAKGGNIHIDPSKKGTFTAAAKKYGQSVQEFAKKVLANKNEYSSSMVKKANFARNAAKWHDLGGYLRFQNPYRIRQFSTGGDTQEQNNEELAPTTISNADRRALNADIWQSYYEAYDEVNAVMRDNQTRALLKAEEEARRRQKNNSSETEDFEAPMNYGVFDLNPNLNITWPSIAPPTSVDRSSIGTPNYRSLETPINYGVFDYNPYLRSGTEFPGVEPPQFDKNFKGTSVTNSNIREDNIDYEAPINYGILSAAPYLNTSLDFPTKRLSSYRKAPSLLHKNLPVIPRITYGRSLEDIAVKALSGNRESKPFEKSTQELSTPIKRKGLSPMQKKLLKFGDVDEPLKKGRERLPSTWEAGLYAPVLASVGVAVSDILSKPEQVSYGRMDLTPYMHRRRLVYDPIDQEYLANKLRAQSGATARQIINNSAGNPSTASAALVANNYNTMNALGDMYIKSNEVNQQRKEKVATFDAAQDRALASLAAQQQQFNINTDVMEQTINAQNRAAARTSNRSGILNIGQNLGEISRYLGDIQTLENIYDYDFRGRWLGNSEAYGGFLHNNEILDFLYKVKKGGK